MEAWKFVKIAKAAVVNYANAHARSAIVDVDDVDIVWMHQTEHTNRAILTLIPPDGILYEVTYSKQKGLLLSIFSQSQMVNVPL